MDGLYLVLAVGLALPLLLLWWGRRSRDGAGSGDVAPHGKLSEAEIDALRRAAGLYTGPLPDEERRAFEKASKIVRARVLSAYQTGERINLRIVMDISLRVAAPEGPYETVLKEPIEYKDLHRFAAGNDIDVYANPNDRTKVLLCDPEIAAIDRDMHAEDRP